MNLTFVQTIAGVAIALSFPAVAVAQAYPSRVVRIVVPGPPGGNTDALARLVAGKLTSTWKRQVIVENRAGASGMIGSEFVAQSASDGYTLMVGHNGTHAINSKIRQNLSYDPVADFFPVTLAAKFPNVFIVHPSVPAKSLPQLIALAKSKPGELSFGTSGIGFPQHLAGEVFNMRAKIKMVHIPYKGTAAGLVDTMAGNIPLMISNLPIALPQIRAGKVRALAVTSINRSGASPEIPTVSESALPGYEVITWYGFFAPVGLPDEISGFLAKHITAALKQKDTRDLLVGQGGEVIASSSKEFAAFIQLELSRWAEVVKATSARAE
jgi:tripartite-type tricarboxylate transporter receptor subunit TctC